MPRILSSQLHINMDDKYKRKFTRKEVLTKVYNDVLERLIGFKIDSEFFPMKSKTFKHDSPDAIQAQRDALTAKDSVRNNELTLQVIDGLLTKLEKKEKSKN